MMSCASPSQVPHAHRPRLGLSPPQPRVQPQSSVRFFYTATATTEIYTLSLHDALPISPHRGVRYRRALALKEGPQEPGRAGRSEEHTSELQSRQYLVCRLLLEKKKHSE